MPANSMDSTNKTFFGLATIRYSHILDCRAFARVSKLENNPSHADIYFGVVLQKGEPAPAEINFALKELATRACYFPDPNPASVEWTGEDINEC